MGKRLYLTVAALSFGAAAARADFSYEQTSRMTGGMLMHMTLFMPKEVKDPKHTTTAVKGNRLVFKDQRMAQIIDLDKQTITRVHFDQKTYSVMTFEQMKQALNDISSRMRGASAKQDTPKVDFKVSLKATGQSKQILGQSAKETILDMTMEGQDQSTGNKGGLNVNVDMWVAPGVDGVSELHAFHRRMAEKLDWSPDAMPMMNRPDMAKAMGELAKEGAQMNGLPLYEVVKVGGHMEGMPDTGTTASEGSHPAPSQAPTSVSDALGSALGSKLGGFGGFGRKKKTPQEAPATQTADASTPATSTASGSLMEMTTEVTSYSAAPVDAALFQVPAGFRQIEEDALGKARR